MTPVAAAELARRIGSSGTFILTGPATAGGANNTTTVTYSGVNAGTGEVTITDIGANRIAGCLVGPSDGSQSPMTLVPDGYGLLIGEDSADIDWPMLPIGGVLDVALILPYVTDATLVAWVKSSLSGPLKGRYTFRDEF